MGGRSCSGALLGVLWPPPRLVVSPQQTKQRSRSPVVSITVSHPHTSEHLPAPPGIHTRVYTFYYFIGLLSDRNSFRSWRVGSQKNRHLKSKTRCPKSCATLWYKDINYTSVVFWKDSCPPIPDPFLLLFTEGNFTL